MQSGRSSHGAGVSRSNIKASTAATAKQTALVEEGNTGLAQLMDECEQFMSRIDNDRIQRSVHENMMFDDDDAAAAEMRDIPNEREDENDNSDESYGEEKIILKEMQVDEVPDNIRGNIQDDESDDDNQLQQLLSQDGNIPMMPPKKS